MDSESVEKIIEAALPDLSPEERAVVEIIRGASSGGVSATQNDIAKSKPWIGAHPKHEGHLPATHETTLRRVREIVRRLRLDRGLPILSDRDGYRFPGSLEECKKYLARLEREAKARAWSSLETYRGMSKVLNLKSKYFEQVEKMHKQPEFKFDDLLKSENVAKPRKRVMSQDGPKPEKTANTGP